MGKRGRLIVIEGIGGCGKDTQAVLLQEKLRSCDVTGTIINFPRYCEAPFGHLVKDYLSGEFGNPELVHPKLASVLYAGDKLVMASKVETLLASGIWVIAVRYVASNQAYQGAKINDLQQRKAFYNWVEDLEHRHNKMPREDILFWLDVPYKTGLKNIDVRTGEKGSSEGKDGHEQQLEFASKVAKNYGELQSRSSTWVRVVCTELKGGSMRLKEKIAEEIFEKVKEKFQVAR